MGITECVIHGKCGIIPLCKHLVQNIESGDNPDRILSIHSYFGDFFSDPHRPMYLGFLYCLNCVKEKNYPSLSTVLGSQEYEALQLNDITGICEECFENALEKYKISWDDIEPKTI